MCTPIDSRFTSFDQRSFFLHWPAMTAEIHNWPVLRINDCCMPSHRLGEDATQKKEPEKWEEQCGMLTSGYDMTISLYNSQ